MFLSLLTPNFQIPVSIYWFIQLPGTMSKCNNNSPVQEVSSGKTVNVQENKTSSGNDISIVETKQNSIDKVVKLENKLCNTADDKECNNTNENSTVEVVSSTNEDQSTENNQTHIDEINAKTDITERESYKSQILPLELIQHKKTDVIVKNTCESKKSSSSVQIANPYLKTSQDDTARPVAIPEDTKEFGNNMRYPGTLSATISTPTKRKTPNISVMNVVSKKNKKENQQVQGIKLLLEGYAFHDDIIGVAHRKNNGEEAFNLTLRNMIFHKELEDEGFSVYATLRDASSGKLDEPLRGRDGYVKYLFLSINVHHFINTTDAHDAVITQCEKLYSVRTLH